MLRLTYPPAKAQPCPKLRLPAPLGLSKPWERLILVLECYFDTSGTTDGQNTYLTMAGYMALASVWPQFEAAARAVLDQYGVTVLHAKEFYDTKGEFTGWKRDKKEAFATEIQGCIAGRLDLGICFSAHKDKWREAKQTHRLAHQESAFGSTFRYIVYELLKDSVANQALTDIPNCTLSFVLENGDANAGDAQRIYNELRLRPGGTKLLKSFGFAAKEDFIALQIADFLAVTTRRYVCRYSDETGYPEEPQIISILRSNIYLIDLVGFKFEPLSSEMASPVEASAAGQGS